ncbi:uracil-DNA glycosylase [Besnoitia besnoiti]|uniref:Uracil-DNA glycosylase n=1 Tax=Besnoitia besnoiti TaxID=94643 RepID=A0A2A9M0T4_BESBE|nr:uracil-DNA glycosylase [Besnoitia besnoiti]PFH31569.1 uracil-DNA glycosylase [Besnoitia besnoiti]
MDGRVTSFACDTPRGIQLKENVPLNAMGTGGTSCDSGTADSLLSVQQSVTVEQSVTTTAGDRVPVPGKVAPERPTEKKLNSGRDHPGPTLLPSKKRSGESLCLANNKRPVPGSGHTFSGIEKRTCRSTTLTSFFLPRQKVAGTERTPGAGLSPATCSRQGEPVCKTRLSQTETALAGNSPEDRTSTQQGCGNVSAALSTSSPGDLFVDPDGEMRPVADAEAVWRQTLGDSWFEALKDELRLPYFRNCMQFVRRERQKYRVYPPHHLVFNAFKTTPLDTVKVVVVGQDPYHQPRQAMGLSFSVPRGVPLPPSLKNIFKEIARNYPELKVVDPLTNKISGAVQGDLTVWASQGVFLLNSLLTVRESTPMSHRDAGWDRFTTKVIDVINTRRQGIVFLLWGKPAQKKSAGVSRVRHRILEAGHPSPLSVRFFQGCQHFSKCNELLRGMGKEEISFAPSS